MYLSKKTYVKNWDHNPKERHFDIKIRQNDQPYPFIDTNNITYIEEEAMYWRKANQIHAWFVKHCPFRSLSSWANSLSQTWRTSD